MFVQSLPGQIDFATIQTPEEAVTVTSATVNGDDIDLAEYIGHGVFQLVGSPNGAGKSMTVRLRHSDTAGSGYVDVPGGAFPDPIDANNDNGYQRLELDLGSLKQFVNVAFTVTGGTGESTAYVGLVAQRRYNHG